MPNLKKKLRELSLFQAIQIKYIDSPNNQVKAQCAQFIKLITEKKVINVLQ